MLLSPAKSWFLIFPFASGSTRKSTHFSPHIRYSFLSYHIRLCVSPLGSPRWLLPFAFVSSSLSPNSPKPKRQAFGGNSFRSLDSRHTLTLLPTQSLRNNNSLCDDYTRPNFPQTSIQLICLFAARSLSNIISISEHSYVAFSRCALNSSCLVIQGDLKPG